MNLKLHEIVALHYELNGITKQSKDGSSEIISQGLMKQKTNMKTKLYLQRLNAVVSAEFKLYSEAEQELFKKYGEEKDGMITIKNEKIADLTKEREDLLTAEKDIDVSTLWSGDLTIDSVADIETDEIYPVFLKLIDIKQMTQNIAVFMAGQAIMIIIGLISIYVKVSLKLKELEVRVSMVEKQEDMITKKLDHILETINKLAIALQNKQDR